MLHQFDAKIDVRSWMGYAHDLLTTWAQGFGKAYTDHLRTTARPGGPSGARGRAWPIKTGKSSRSFKYRVKDLGEQQVTLDIYNTAMSGPSPGFSSTSRGGFYAVDVEFDNLTSFNNPNYNRGAAWNVLRKNWDLLAARASAHLYNASQGAGFTPDVHGPGF